MEVVEKEGVKVPNAVLISGITDTEVDEEILDFLAQYGSIIRSIPVIDPSLESKKSLIVEFSSGLAVQNLQEMLPYVQQAEDNPDISFHVTALSDTYIQKLGKTTTQSYLNDLKELASRSGESFEDVLKGILDHIQETIIQKPCLEPTLVGPDESLPVHSADPPQTEFTFKQSQVPINAAQHHTVPPASAYLQRLHVALQTTMRRGGVLSSEVDKHLLKQFCRGCWESPLLLELQLEQKKNSPPSFAELMTMLRTEESKQASKNVRMKQHLGNPKWTVLEPEGFFQQ
nr:uncharacterized protein LOC129437325 [Misgurnus anguillicaudatus]